MPETTEKANTGNMVNFPQDIAPLSNLAYFLKRLLCDYGFSDQRKSDMLPIISTGLMAANKTISAISNNIANASSSGFKRSNVDFQDIYAATPDQLGSTVTGMGTRTNAVRVNHAQGALKTTNISLDMAVSGRGMFVTTDPTGQERIFTRNGNFSLNDQGQIVTGTGNLLMSRANRPITVPLSIIDAAGNRTLLDSITVSPKGDVMTTYGGFEPISAGQIALAGFRNLNGLRQKGLNEFVETELSGAPKFGSPADGVFGTVIQGSIETSNTNISDEMTRMLLAQQAFGASSKMMQTEADITRRLIG